MRYLRQLWRCGLDVLRLNLLRLLLRHLLDLVELLLDACRKFCAIRKRNDELKEGYLAGRFVPSVAVAGCRFAILEKQSADQVET